MARAPALQAGGRRFDSDYLHQIANRLPDIWEAIFLLPIYSLSLSADMEKFQPFSLDYDAPAQGELLGEVKAGFPSPAEDIREKLDLMKLLVRHKASTFFDIIDIFGWQSPCNLVIFKDLHKLDENSFI